MKPTSSVHRAGEFVIWVLAASLIVVSVCTLGAFVLGDGLLTLKYALFAVGFLLFGFGSLGIQPKSPKRESQRVTADSARAWGFEERLHRLPPLRDWYLPFDERVSRDTKIFTTSLVVLGVSLFLEFVVGVRV